MTDLTPRQRALLRALAQTIKPVLQVGRDGVTSTVIDSITDALHTRELLKLKVLDTAPADAPATATDIARLMPDVHVVQVIGRTLVLYRRHPENPIIRLPG